MSGIESLPKNQKNEIEKDTLEAIVDGRAMPLPDFLNESSEAREAFTEALGKSEELRKGLEQLSPEERLLFIQKFTEALENDNPSQLESWLQGGYLGLAPTGGVIAVSAGSPLFGMVTLGTSLVMLLSGLYLHSSRKSEKNELKKLIIESVTG